MLKILIKIFSDSSPNGLLTKLILSKFCIKSVFVSLVKASAKYSNPTFVTPQFGIVNNFNFFRCFIIVISILNPLSPNWLSHKLISFKFFNFINSFFTASNPVSVIVFPFKFSTSILLFTSKANFEILLSVKELKDKFNILSSFKYAKASDNLVHSLLPILFPTIVRQLSFLKELK